MIPDPQLADELISRLNTLIQDPEVREAVERLVECRIPCSEILDDHPTIQVSGAGLLGFFGLLNGIVGTIPEGPNLGWGYITANYDDSGRLTHFDRTGA